jgi:hypothetical protein
LKEERKKQRKREKGREKKKERKNPKYSFAILNMNKIVKVAHLIKTIVY